MYNVKSLNVSKRPNRNISAILQKTCRLVAGVASCNDEHYLWMSNVSSDIRQFLAQIIHSRHPDWNADESSRQVGQLQPS